MRLSPETCRVKAIAKNKNAIVAPCWTYFTYYKYRVIRKSILDFRPLRYSSQDGHDEGEHVNRGRDTLSFCPTLQLLDVSTKGGHIEHLPQTCNVCGRNLITGLTSTASPRVDVSSTCKVGQKLGVSVPLRDHPGYCTAEVGNPGGT